MTGPARPDHTSPDHPSLQQADDLPSLRRGLVVNVMHFARALRTAGLPVGPATVLRAVEAMEAVGLDRREDVYWALHAVFVIRHDQTPLFDQAFHIFWRNPDILKRMMALMLPKVRSESDDRRDPLARRLAEALDEDGEKPEEQAPERTEIEFDATFTLSAEERLQKKDFEKMSLEELAEAKRLLAQMTLPVAPIITRRYRSDPRGNRIDARQTLRRMVRGGGDLFTLARKRRVTRVPPLVMLCDISGAMTRYSRMLLHFMHAVANDRDRVHAFVFGTRLTNITRQLRQRDVDDAVDAVSSQVVDWSGGTRIGSAISCFNRDWGRRVLGQNAVVMLITDGLDRDSGEGLGPAAERLRKSCKRLIWLNPLLRWEGFAPKSSGIRALMPHVDEFRPVHNLDSLAGLAQALAKPAVRQDQALRRWLRETPVADSSGC